MSADGPGGGAGPDWFEDLDARLRGPSGRSTTEGVRSDGPNGEATVATDPVDDLQRERREARSRLHARLKELHLPRAAIERTLDDMGRWTELDPVIAAHELALRVVDAEERAARERHRFLRLRGRRSVRYATLLAEIVGRLRRGEPRGEPDRRLRDHLAAPPTDGPRPEPAALRAALDPPAGPDRRDLPRYLRPEVRERRPRYPHLRVGQIGASPFRGLAPHVTLEGATDEELALGIDLVIVGPEETGSPPATDGLEVVGDGVPVALVAARPSDLDHPLADRAHLVVTEALDVAHRAEERGTDCLLLLPSVDPWVTNPVGWQEEPPGEVAVVVTDTERADDTLSTLVASLDADVAVFTVPGVVPERLPEGLRGRVRGEVGGPEDLAAVAHDHRVVIADRAWHPDPTTYLRHVLEVTAAGTPVVTTDPEATDLLDPAVPVRVASDAAAAAEAVRELVADPFLRERESIRARRTVLGHHTRGDRLDTLLDALGLPVRQPELVSLVLSTNRPHLLDHAIANASRQTYPAKELVLVLHGDGFDPAAVERLTVETDIPVTVVRRPTSATFGDCLNAGIAASSGDLVAKMDDDDAYGPAYLTDLVLALGYSGAAVVGKRARFLYLKPSDVTLSREPHIAERYRKKVSGATMLMRREIATRFGFLRRQRQLDTTFARRVEMAGGTLYVTHAFDFAFGRHGDGHTWDPGRSHFTDDADASWPGLATDAVFTEPATDEVARWGGPTT